MAGKKCCEKREGAAMAGHAVNAYDTMMGMLDEERRAVEDLIGILERHPDLAKKLAVFLKIAAERR